MLSNNARNPNNSEPESPTSSPCPSGADRGVYEEEKGNRTGNSSSSSGGSSASDLKRRLQDLPSPNEPALLASRAINTSRRLSRKRDLYFYSATNRIDENDEKEEQESIQPRRSSESNNSDARTRRRAKFRSGGMQAQTSASQPNSGNNSDELLSLDETPRTDSQRHASLSKTASTLSACCDQLPVISSARSQKSPPLFRISSSAASLCSTPSKFGGYRPHSGVILQNLSSGSEPSSDYENVTDRIGFHPKIELDPVSSYGRVSRIPTPREIFNSSDISSRHSTASSYNRVSRMPAPQEVFSNFDSSMNLAVSPGSKISYDESLSPINESPINDDNHGSSMMSFYRVKGTSRSDCCDTKNSTDKIIDQRKLLSARESLSSYRIQTLEPLSPLGTRRNVSAERVSTEVRNYYEEGRYGEESLRSYQKVSSSKESLGNLSYNADQTAALQAQYQENLGSRMTKAAYSAGSFAKDSMHSLESVSSKPGLENLQTQYQENLGSPVTKAAFSAGSSDKGSMHSLESVSSKPGLENLKTQYQENFGSPMTKAAFPEDAYAEGSVQSLESVYSRSGLEKNLGSQLSKASSKCYLDQSKTKSTRTPLSTPRVHERTERLSSPGFRDCSSERNSAISDILEFRSRDSTKMEEDVVGRVSTRSQDSREYVNVPSLALNSQDVSSSSSSLCKTASKKRVNPDDLIESLSNVSLLQTENTYRLSPRTSSGKREIVDASKNSTNFDENYESCASSRSHAAKPAVKSGERIGLDPVSMESDRQAYLKNFLVSDSESESNPGSDKESSPRNFENNETSNSSRAVDLEKDVASKAINMDETFKSKPPDDNEDLTEDSEDSESPRSEGKPINRYKSPNCYETLESLSNDLENSDNFLAKLKSVESTYPISCQVNYMQSTYEGEVSDKLTEKGRLNLLDNQIGDGQDAFVEDATKFEPSESSEDEDPEDKLIEGKIRVSMEKMAADQFRRNIYGEQARSIQSDCLSFFTEKLYETVSVTESASTSKLRYSHDSPKFRKKSQDRFPFTMSEKPSVVSHKHPGRLDSLNEESKSTERTYKLELHPSITRLAGEGFEETPAEIIDYVSFNEGRPLRSGMRGLMRKFSARLKKSKKPNEEAAAVTTDVLYENRDYQGDSVVDSCSESSLLKELKANNSGISKNPSTVKESPEEKSSVVTEKSLIKNESSKDMLPSASSYRRRDRDNLWVQEIKNSDPNRIEEMKITETPKKNEDKSKKDPYSVFFVKNSQQTPETSARESLPEEEPKSEISTGRRNKVKFRGSGLAVMPKTSDENVLRGSIKRRNLEKRKEAGCLCLRFYRMIIPVVRYRSWKRKSSGSLSAKRRPGFSPGKRKG